MNAKTYLEECNYMRKYIITIPVVIFLSYSVYLFCTDSMVEKMSDENQFFEIGTASLFLVTSFLFAISYFTNKNVFMLLLCVLLFFGAGEELSWGQRLLNFKTPVSLNKINVQHEFNLHNIEIFNTNNFDFTVKKGWHRLLEINFLFRVFIMIFGIVLPISANHIIWTKGLIDKLKLPVPPISIGIFFLASWITLELVLKNLPAGKSQKYYQSTVEIFEFLTSYVFFMIGLYFFQMRKKNIFGRDIKDYFTETNEYSSYKKSKELFK